jgi:hypothetical protein
MLVAMNTYAALPGLYLGGQVGWGNVTDSGISRQEMGDLIESAIGNDNYTIHTFNGTTSGTGLAGRVYIGYQIGCFFAAELGWTKFNSLPIAATARAVDENNGAPIFVSTSGTLKVSAFDFVGKGIVPLPYHFNVYGKLGIGYVEGRSNSSVFFNDNGVFKTSTSESGGDITRRFFPTFGLGVAYDFRPDIEVDLSWNRIQKIGNSQELGSTDFFSLGLAFHFDKWGVFYQ